jgi:GDPmannose 4,6-dehydratase
MNKKVLVTGVSGQDGANMCELLLRDSSTKVFGMIRRVSNPNYVNCLNFLDHPNFQLVYGDLTDEVSISKLVREIQPGYFINFAANSFVACSWEMPLHVFDTNTLGVIRCLEAIRSYQPNCRFYSAGSSEELGDVDYSPQDINHPIKPRSPYGASKAATRHIVKVYRESYGMYAVHGVLFNHEGTKRGEEFVTRKITKGVARIKRHLDAKTAAFNPIELGNIYAKRDWSDSEDFVEGVWLMLNQKEPKDYILASGETHTIKDFIEKAFLTAGIHGDWVETDGQPLDTTYQMSGDQHRVLVKINPKFYRPAEVALLHGDASPAKEELGWNPKVSFDELVSKMVKWDIENEQEQTPIP